MLKIDEEYKVKCISINNYAKGVAKIDSFIVFVDDFYPDEEAIIKIIDVKKNYAFAKVINLLKRAPYRINSVCDHSLESGSCPFSDIIYEQELKFKKRIVLDDINRALSLSLEDINITSGDIINGYRNKVTVFFNENYEFGYFRENSNDFVRVDSCVQIDDGILLIIKDAQTLLRKYNIQTVNYSMKSGIIKGVVIRKSFTFDKYSVMFLSRKDKSDLFFEFSKELHNLNQKITGISFNINDSFDTFIYSGFIHQYYGTNDILEKILDITFRVDMASFMQVNTSCASKLYSKAISLANLKKEDSVLDLYCGCGGISLNLAKYVKHVYGVETVKSAVINARKNAIFNGINNATFYAIDAKDYDKFLENKKINIVFVDPPKSGLDKKVIESFLKHNYEKIIYVSCNSYTLSRDLKMMSSKYNLLTIEAFDLFPRTKHVESIATISLNK